MGKAKNRFAEHVTSAAFSLTLSKPMIDVLAVYAALEVNEAPWSDEVYALLYGHPHSTSSTDALERRGLVDQRKGRYARLTQAGWALLPVLELAGLLPTAKEVASLGAEAKRRLKENSNKALGASK